MTPLLISVSHNSSFTQATLTNGINAHLRNELANSESTKLLVISYDTMRSLNVIPFFTLPNFEPCVPCLTVQLFLTSFKQAPFFFCFISNTWQQVI